MLFVPKNDYWRKFIADEEVFAICACDICWDAFEEFEEDGNLIQPILFRVNCSFCGQDAGVKTKGCKEKYWYCNNSCEKIHAVCPL
tara:strand:- start:1361 stop:1618 length:258 start_codon:yes stop_codon:yes gene_type:complete